VRLEARAEATRVVVSVADTGPGVAPEDLPHVFDAYWQAERSRRGTSASGLSITRTLVEAHGGRVWAESAPGEGSRFSVALPLLRRGRPPALTRLAAPGPRGAPAAAPPGSGRRRPAAGRRWASPAPSPAGRGGGRETTHAATSAASRSVSVPGRSSGMLWRMNPAAVEEARAIPARRLKRSARRTPARAPQFPAVAVYTRARGGDTARRARCRAARTGRHAARPAPPRARRRGARARGTPCRTSVRAFAGVVVRDARAVEDPPHAAV
jgi:hypothetical protein